MKSARELARTMEGACLGMRVTRLQRLVSRHFTTALRPTGMTSAQMEILAMLVLTDEAVKPGVLAESLAVERSTMSRNLALMETAGWVAAVTSPTGRTMAIAITPAGQKQLVSGRAAWTTAQGEMIEALGSTAPQLFDQLLGALR